MRRIWAGLVLSLSLAAVLTGCAGDTAKDPAHSPSPSPAADDMKDSFDRMVDNGRVS